MITVLGVKVCLTCDNTGELLVPCSRSDPDRIVPECGHREHPLPSGGCGRVGCMEAVRRVPCWSCGGAVRG